MAVRTARLVACLSVVLAGGALAACSSGPDVEPTGHTTTVTVTVTGMTYSPDRIEVPVGDELVVEFENTGMEMHDIAFDGGAESERLNPGESETVEVGVVGEDMEFWCTVSGHRAQGMEGAVVAVGAE